jgi:hypothetical protein
MKSIFVEKYIKNLKLDIDDLSQDILLAENILKNSQDENEIKLAKKDVQRYEIVLADRLKELERTEEKIRNNEQIDNNIVKMCIDIEDEEAYNAI